MALKNLRVALVCDWLTTFGGAEKVILALHELFPHAPIYTSIYNRDQVPGFEKAMIFTSYLQNLPFAKKHHQLYLGFMPHAFERFDLSNYDLVISSSHCCAKGIITKPNTLHVCYCHSPMRYLWENSHRYIQEYEANRLVKTIAPFFLHKIRLWDRLSADRVDEFIANSHHIQQRIQKYYRRPSTVIYPFVDMKKFERIESNSKRENFFLAVGRLTPYKKFDLVIDTFNQLKLPLKIVGKGVAFKRFQQMAGSTVELLGHVSDEQLLQLYSKAKALIFPQVEDFGIVPLEAMAAGCPVIAYRKGGAVETVVEKKTGIFFDEQNVASLRAALEKFDTMNLSSKVIIDHARTFDKSVFQKKMIEFLEKKWHEHSR